MVPAAPLLPTTDPVSAVVVHRAGPAGVVDEDAEGDVDTVVELGAAVVLGDAVVLAGDALDEHAPRTTPPMAAAITTPAPRAEARPDPGRRR